MAGVSAVEGRVGECGRVLTSWHSATCLHGAWVPAQPMQELQLAWLALAGAAGACCCTGGGSKLKLLLLPLGCRCTYTAWRRTLPSGKSEYKSITIAGAFCAALCSAALCRAVAVHFTCCAELVAALSVLRWSTAPPAAVLTPAAHACLVPCSCRGLDGRGVHGLLPG